MRLLIPQLLTITLLSFSALAQSESPDQPRTMLTGTVYDVNGSVITDGKIVAYAADGKEYVTAPNDEGVYKFELPLTRYRIDVSSPGFCLGRVQHFRMVNATHGKMSLDFVLEVPGSRGRCRHELIKEKRPERRSKQKPDLVGE